MWQYDISIIFETFILTFFFNYWIFIPLILNFFNWCLSQEANNRGFVSQSSFTWFFTYLFEGSNRSSLFIISKCCFCSFVNQVCNSLFQWVDDSILIWAFHCMQFWSSLISFFDIFRSQKSDFSFKLSNLWLLKPIIDICSSIFAWWLHWLTDLDVSYISINQLIQRW